MNAMDMYLQTLLTLTNSDIVWTKYGSDTREKLAARITRIVYPSFETPLTGETDVVETPNTISKGVWQQECSSGYNGFRCQKCATWLYADEVLKCDCDA